MIKDLTKPEIKAEIIARISKLQSNSAPQWGKMNVSQMMAHCQAQMRVALGDEKLKHSLMGKLLGGFFKKSLTEEKPCGKNLPTFPSFLVKHQPDFETERNKFINMLIRFKPGAITREPHPFFGKMTLEEWSRGTWKHLDHHLKQFRI